MNRENGKRRKIYFTAAYALLIAINILILALGIYLAVRIMKVL
ncbi:MAG TPA: hypothetical protein PK986_10610 [Spirochaetota bacterium]|nr:hypothetical protein [Spirochaetota bacterium]